MTVQIDGIMVFDTGPLSHFAKSNWLGILKTLSGHQRAVIPDIVHQELRQGASSYPHLERVLACDWLEIVELSSDEELNLFATYSASLVGPDRRNVGESAVLAMAEARSATAVVDDRVARNVARARRVTVKGSLGLMCDAIRVNLLTVPLVSAIADDLLAGDYRLPFKPGGFERWAHENDTF